MPLTGEHVVIIVENHVPGDQAAHTVPMAEPQGFAGVQITWILKELSVFTLAFHSTFPIVIGRFGTGSCYSRLSLR